ncbi:TRAP-type mannitol/chloroaromatic compound transport system, substrate-binding protein [Tranquillimonas rosea]|uniref:TRAP-type mannitol/chloroaromatic compound transport system, substrate-binding protein n=1 Tax=Tranquillimonas rosea TaxID=641238 RepID=A0A1H9UYU2_9RHOB|nr:TRAP transporter substrate-binding protein [Tranquillimonas rosea]SES14655.1 TRAP-type mannitol/chloroaromatic compound transport system, substrate-binding protein [Tranquillimonas rosea]
MERRKFLTSAALGAAAAPLATPALAQSRTDMVIVSTWGRDFPGLGTSAQRLSARIEELTEGRIAVQYFAAGERVGAFDSFDEVASGNAQGYIAGDYYWKGKHAGWAPFAAIPFGLTYTEMDAWMKFMGGQELHDKLGDEFGLKGFACGNTGVQMGGWFNKEINSPDDLRGLKMRIPGLGGDVMAKVGASPVSLPGGQIYENLVSGAIDATEWVGPWNDFFLKLYEAAQYYYWPGFHEPGTQLTLGMNKEWWSGLSANDQNLIEAACNEENARQAAETNANNGVYLQRLLDEYGVELREFNDDIYEALGEASNEVIEETRDHSALAAEIIDSALAARDQVGAWAALADAPYVAKRNRFLDL